MEEKLESELHPMEILKATCTPDEIDWKQDSKPEKHPRNWARFVPYVDSRALMERLDKAFDHFWSVRTEYMGINKKGKDIYRSTISVRVSDTLTISRDGWAEDTDIGSTKGGESSAFKRAGTAFGFGRDLYNYPVVYVQFEGKWAPFGIERMFRYISELFIRGDVGAGDKLVILEHKTGGVKSLKLHHVEYGKPGREIHGGKAPEPKTVQPVQKRLSEYKESDIIKALYPKTEGKVTKQMEANVLNAWRKGDAKVHVLDHGRYIWIHAADGKTKIWFKLNDYQATKIFK